MRGWIAGLLVGSSMGISAVAGSVDEIPAAFLPFEHMIGGWKGTAKPTANPLKGWQESHGWAWKFEKGKPVGLTIALEGDKTLAKGAISYDEAAKKYKLDGTDPAGKPVAFLGSWSPDGKTLTFDRQGSSPEGKERLTFRPTSNKIRYTLQLDHQEPGAPQYKGVISVGLTKDGEAFAAGSGGADLPKCIMTGGAAGITVSYNGKSYPVCCTGCRDEFNDNPAKYAKIADLAAQSKPAAKDKPAVKGKDDGSFDGLIDEPVAKKAMPEAKPKVESKPKAADAKADAAKAKDDPTIKANRELQLGQNLEKGGKTKPALDHYRTVVKDYPDTEAAKTAAARIKALEGK
jgi:YHS domain-containing protein